MIQLFQPRSPYLKEQLEELGVKFGSHLIRRFDADVPEQRFLFRKVTETEAFLCRVEIKEYPVRHFHYGDDSSTIDMRDGYWILMSHEESELYSVKEREMMEFAAKAAGYLWRGFHTDGKAYLERNPHAPKGGVALCCPFEWSPFCDDAQAFQLAVSVGLSITPYPIYNEKERQSVWVKHRRESDKLREKNPTETIAVYGDDPLAATRRVIVESAAIVGGWGG